MKFFEKYFTRHHFRNNPHRWIVALFLSPIHHAEMRYKVHYHLKFSHAKKVFLFDMLLILSTVLLFAITLFWWQYDPTITSLVHINVSANVDEDRIQSGDIVRIAIHTANNSDVALQSPLLKMSLPPGFVMTTSSRSYTTEGDHTIAFSLDDIQSAQDVTTQIAGTYYGEVDTHRPVRTMLIYTQPEKKQPEIVIHRLLLTTREPSAELHLDSPPHLIPGATLPVTLTVTNARKHTLPSRKITSNNFSLFAADTPSLGTFDEDTKTWEIGSLAEDGQATLEGTVRIPAHTAAETFTFIFSQLLTIEETSFVEEQHTVTLPIARPSIDISSSWNDTFVQVGEKTHLELNLKNTGSIPLETSQISYQGRVWHTDLSLLSPGDTTSLSIPLTATQSNIIEGVDGPIFLPSLTFSATIPNISGYTFTKDVSTPPLPVGTTLTALQQVTYYTPEGDQLGRGPLPPRVGKETKYWIFTQLQNSAGTVRDIVYRTTLAPGTTWTGKSSVSQGADIIYNPNTHTAVWQSQRMSPYQTVGIYFEVAVVPSTNAIGTVPNLVSQSSVFAEDPYVNEQLYSSLGPLYASLREDSIGSAKGTQVVL